MNFVEISDDFLDLFRCWH